MNPPRSRCDIATFLKFSAGFGLFLALLHVGKVDLTFGKGWPDRILLPVGMAFGCALFVLRPIPRASACASCGGRVIPSHPAGQAGLCPSCRIAKYPPEQRRWVNVKALLAIVFLYLLLAFVVLSPLSPLMKVRHGWFAYSALAVGLFVLLFALYFVWAVASALVGSLRMARPGHALKVARTCAGEAGSEVSIGPVSVHVFGQNDPAPMLEDQIETCRRRVEALVGASIAGDHPLRVFAFGKRIAFEGFCRQCLLNPGNLDGAFGPWSTPTIILTSEFAAYRLAEPERVVRTLLSHFYLNTFKKSPSPLWLQAGIANLIACGGDDGELDRLNRKMTASLARGSALGTADLFHCNPPIVVRLLRNWKDQSSFMRYTQLIGQSWSVTEFLCGHKTAGDQRQRFRGFLADLTPNIAQEEVFERHFGYGFDTLLERWRAWVMARGVGTHQPPPESLRHALLKRVIPIVADREANVLERVQAIRDLGRAGYVLGADALIDLLASDDQIPRAEVVWSLEAISGRALGHDSQRSAEGWLATLPAEATGLARADSYAAVTSQGLVARQVRIQEHDRTILASAVGLD